MKRWIVCENLRSAYNVGSIIRTADALGRGVMIAGYSAPASHKEVAKTALGAESYIPLLHCPSLEEMYETIKKDNGFMIAAECLPDATSLTDKKLDTLIPADRSLYLIVGNEVTGVEKNTCDQADLLLMIPMLGHKESLNVCQAGAICMWHINRLFS